MRKLSTEEKHYDKIETKFKPGDWVACYGLNTALIVNINDDKYEVKFVDGTKGFPNIDYIDRLFHRYTIQDAKDGDVLVASDGLIFLFKSDYTYKHYKKTFTEVHPATKEQRDILMKAMADIGYTFDKLELKHKS